MQSSRLIIGFAVGCLMALTSAASACSTPVFRYALEYWPADRYEVVIFHRGPLSSSDRALVDQLQRLGAGDDAGCNCRVTTVDVQISVDQPMLQLWQRQVSAGLPWMVVCSPGGLETGKVLWSGRLTEAAVRSLVDSPVRRDIAKRLLSGHAATWILLESGDPKVDEAVARLLDGELKKATEQLTQELREQETGADGADIPEADRNIKVIFSTVRVSRNDPSESILTAMLLLSEEKLAGSKEPVLFPVFGRGRVLGALAGPRINEDTIMAMATFLVGGCSCQIKGQNPGTDLLMTADWESARQAIGAETVALESLSALLAPTPATRPEAYGATAETDPLGAEKSPSLLRNVSITLGVGVVAIASLAWVLHARRRSCGRHVP